MKYPALIALTASALVLSACGANNDPTDTASDNGADGGTQTITIGTANFPESEIIGQIYAGVLEEAGFDVEISSGIGSREVYMQALEDGDVDIVPEYTGNLAQFYGAELAPGADSQDVYRSLNDVLPQTLAAGNYAEAESKDSYTVTKDKANEFGLATLEDLSKLDRIVIAANPELAQRPYGPQGLADTYGADESKIELNAISDGGGPLTVASLLSDESTVANIYTTSPVLDQEGNEVDVVRLEDTKNLISAQNVLPVYRAHDVPEEAIAALDELSDQLTTEDLIAMNKRNIGEEKAEPPVIAADYVAERA